MSIISAYAKTPKYPGPHHPASIALSSSSVMEMSYLQKEGVAAIPGTFNLLIGLKIKYILEKKGVLLTLPEHIAYPKHFTIYHVV